MATIEIPKDLLPRDGRFGCGPSKVRLAALQSLTGASNVIGTSHRQAPVRQVVGSVRDGLSTCCSMPADYAAGPGEGGDRGRPRDGRGGAAAGRGRVSPPLALAPAPLLCSPA